MKTLKVSLLVLTLMFGTSSAMFARQGILNKAKEKMKSTKSSDKAPAVSKKGKKGNDKTTRDMAVKGQGVPSNPGKNSTSGQ